MSDYDALLIPGGLFSPDDLEAFNAKIVEAICEGRYQEQAA